MQYIIFASFLIAFIISWLSIPAIIRVAEEKHLYDEPDEDRKLHKSKTPTLGGVAVFAGIIITATFFAHQSKNLDLGAFLSAITLLFFTGIKDDIIALPPLKKLLAQLLAAAIVVIWGDVRLSNFYGFFFLYDVPDFVLMMASIFTIIVIMNAFNLIDGINGLAGGIAVMVLSTFGAWFYVHQEESLAVWAFATAGALLGFLRYNFLPKAKIFMGDTGSLTVGFIAAVFAIKFIEMNKTELSFAGGKAPVFAIAVLAVPLFDTLRVFVIRILHKRSPFSGDRNHLHHLLLDVGCSHLQASFTLYSLNLLIIFLGYWLRFLHPYLYLGVLGGAILIFTQILLFLKNKKKIQTEL
ncbi:MAG: MraY family glycosyltransferase [Thermonemataceae bacterium]|nr:MraY family glycosyltransferase [Thermonemataceae bacterium]